MDARGLALALALSGCAPAAMTAAESPSHIQFHAEVPAPGEKKHNDAWAVTGWVALGAFVTGFTVFVLFVLPQTSAGG